MKTLSTIPAILILMWISFSSCSSQRSTATSNPLYKSEEGKTTSYKSYDRAMELWECEYTEEFIANDFGVTHMIISGVSNDKALVLLPGLFGDACMWYPNVSELSKHYKVYAPDMINYGGKSIPSENKIKNIQDYEKWFTQILNHYNIDQCAVMGLSYGSWLALALAREQPEWISELVLLDPSETFMPMNGGIAWKGFKYFMFFPNRNKYEKFFDWMGGGFSDPECEIWTEHILDVIEHGSVKMFDIPQHKIYNREELSMVDMPVLIMAGGKPILYDDPAEFAVNAKNALPQAKVIIVSNAGHGLNMEQGEFVNTEILKFLKASKRQTTIQ